MAGVVANEVDVSGNSDLSKKKFQIFFTCNFYSIAYEKVVVPGDTNTIGIVGCVYAVVRMSE